MQKYQDTATGQEWHFDDDVIVEALPNLPSTLSTIIIPRPSLLHDWVNGVWVADLTKAQAAQITILTGAYNAAIQLPVSYLGTTFQADDASQDVLTKVLAAGVLPDGFFWVDVHNAQVPMTFVQLQGLAAAMLAQGQAAFARLQSLKSQVRAATTPDAVQAIVWA